MARATAPLLTRAGRACAALLALVLLLPAAADAAGRLGERDLGPLASTVVAALAQSSAGHALDTLGNGLALIEARKRIERVEAKRAKEARVDEAAAHEAPTIAEIEEDPSKMPPASAGSNGAYEPSSAATSGKLFAHSRAAAGGSTSILLSGIALAPPDAPEAVKGVVNNANAIVGRPYVWGGGHGGWYSAGYDCSGSVSFALFGGGLIPEPLTSGALEGWGAPGPGKWITVYANAGHTFAEIAGLRWDTVGDENGTGPRWHLASTSTAGFVARHPPGL
jgi:cell wall-associated NlpC family hydrolase